MFNSVPFVASSNIIKVPQNYPTIQEAINAAVSGDTVFVENGTYFEHIVVNKTISLVGENKTNTIIDGNGTGIVVKVTAINVKICGFTIKKGEVRVCYITGKPNVNANITGNTITSGRVYVEFSSSNNTIARNRFFNAGIEIDGSKNIIIGNIISNCSQFPGAIYLYRGQNYVGDNQIFWNPLGGITIYSVSGSNVLRNNTMFDNGRNFGFYSRVSVNFQELIQDIDTSNTVNGKPIYYLVNEQNMVVPEDAGYVAVVNSTNITVKGLNITNNWQGVVCAYSSGCVIQNVSTNTFDVVKCSNLLVENCSGGLTFRKTNSSTITNSYTSSYLEFSNNNRITNNYGGAGLTASNSNVIDNNYGGTTIWGYQYGGHFWASVNNTVVNNVGGIDVRNSNNNTICNNTIGSGHYSSIDLFNAYGPAGINLEGASNNTIKYNNVTGGVVGIMLLSSVMICKNNVVIGNIVTNNTVGVLLGGSRTVFKENILLNNRYNFGGGVLDVDASNTINGKPIHIFANQSDFIIDPSTHPDIGYLTLSNCTNVTIRDLTLTNNIEGLLLYNTKNVTVSNCTLQENVLGLEVQGSFNNITNNKISNNLKGLTLRGEGNNTISENTITNNTYRNLAPGDPRFDLGSMPPLYSHYLRPRLILMPSAGFDIWGSVNNTITSNTITNNERGIFLIGGENTFKNNILSGNNFNIDFYGAESRANLYQLTQDMDSTNLVEGKPVCYWINQHDKQVPEDAGFVVLVNCTNITVQNLNITHSRMGIVLAGTNNTIVTNVTTTNCLYGIFVRNVPREEGDPYHGPLISSFNNTIANCTLTNNGAGIALYGANLTSALNNIVSENMMGIWIYGSSYNLIKGNSVTNNTVPLMGPWPFPEGEGPTPILLLMDYGGIVVEGFFNIITENTVAYNDVGLSVGAPIVGSPWGNWIYHNNFINNTEQLWVGSINFWDIGYPEGGNYYSDYTGTDNHSGINQTEPGCDGIGDTPYFLIWGGRSSGYPYTGWAYYPIMTPWTPTPTKTFTLNISNTFHKVVFDTNSTITHLQLNRTDPAHPTLVFNATDTPGTTGYCNITIPKTLITAEPLDAWTIIVNGTLTTRIVTDNDTHTFISFTYTYHSTLKIEIQGTWAVPENHTPLIMTLILLTTLLCIFVTKKHKKHQLRKT
jgi:parallel beta-helix repeat protein